MAFVISEWISPFTGGGGGGVVTVPLPLPIGFSVAEGTVIAAIPTTYQMLKLIYTVYRNGVEQVPDKDFTKVGNDLSFVQPFIYGEYVRFYPNGFSA